MQTLLTLAIRANDDARPGIEKLEEVRRPRDQAQD